MLTTFSGRRASQNEYELRSMIEFFVNAGVKSYLEIGARHGDTFHEVMINLPVGSRGVAVDLPGGLWGRDDTAKSLFKAVDDLRQRGYIIDVILGDSTEQPVIDKVISKFPFDACLIDGNHLYDGVKADWNNYRGTSAIVCFHDTVGEGQTEKQFSNPVEVPRLWAEIKADPLYSHRCHDFVDAGSKMGIGLCDLR